MFFLRLFARMRAIYVDVIFVTIDHRDTQTNACIFSTVVDITQKLMLILENRLKETTARFMFNSAFHSFTFDYFIIKAYRTVFSDGVCLSFAIHPLASIRLNILTFALSR
jgi:hypothetical protein